MSATNPAAETLSLVDIDDQQAVNIDVAHIYCPAARVVANWHNGVHEGGYATCQEQPCNAVRRVSD
jgi:hypothetical protein